MNRKWGKWTRIEQIHSHLIVIHFPYFSLYSSTSFLSTLFIHSSRMSRHHLFTHFKSIPYSRNFITHVKTPFIRYYLFIFFQRLHYSLTSHNHIFKHLTIHLTFYLFIYLYSIYLSVLNSRLTINITHALTSQPHFNSLASHSPRSLFTHLTPPLILYLIIHPLQLPTTSSWEGQRSRWDTKEVKSPLTPSPPNLRFLFWLHSRMKKKMNENRMKTRLLSKRFMR